MTTPVLDPYPTAHVAANMGLRQYLEDFQLFAPEGLRGPEWTRTLRTRAMEQVQRAGFPTPRNEDWHFTSVAPITEAEFRLLHNPSVDVKAEDLAPFIFGHAEWPTLVFVNGRLSSSLSNLHTLPRGVRLLDLARAWREESRLLERHLTTQASVEQHAFTALNTAFMYDGAVVQIAPDTTVTTPIHLLFVSDANAARSVAHPRNLILVGRGARATVIESYVALGEPGYFTNAVSEVLVGDGATLAHCKIQRESLRAFHVGTTEVRQGRDSHLLSFSFATGATLSRTNIYTVLAGPGSGATLHGLYMVDGEQHVDHQTRIEHAEPNCFSREVYKGILDGASHGVFNGKVFVRPAAQKTDGKQENNNLLLSNRARVDTKPQLEIFADDVKCTHGATVGKLDEQALFYMRSRGIDRTLARQLLTYAFAADVLEQIEAEPVRQGLEEITLRRFTTNGNGDAACGLRTEEGGSAFLLRPMPLSLSSSRNPRSLFPDFSSLLPPLAPPPAPPPFIAVARLEDVPPGAIVAVVGSAGEPICLVNCDGEILALSDVCTHQEFPMSLGTLLPDGVIECACHGARFDCRTGTVMLPPAEEALPCYDVRVENGEILVGARRP